MHHYLSSFFVVSEINLFLVLLDLFTVVFFCFDMNENSFSSLLIMIYIFYSPYQLCRPITLQPLQFFKPFNLFSRCAWQSLSRINSCSQKMKLHSHCYPHELKHSQNYCGKESKVSYLIYIMCLIKLPILNNTNFVRPNLLNIC